MPANTSTGRQYFLGIGGEQSGPFSEDEILSRIYDGSVTNDALVWFEGLPDWQPILSFEFFNHAFTEHEAQPPAALSPQHPMQGNAGAYASPAAKQPTAYSQTEGYHGMVSNSSSGAPIFSVSEGRFGGRYVASRLVILLMGITVVIFGTLAYVYMQPERRTHSPEPQAATATRQIQNEAPAAKQISPAERREKVLRAALSELLIKPVESIKELEKLIAEDANDNIGKQAVEAVVTYYKQKRLNSEAGRLLMKVNRPLEASQMFLSDPPSYSEAEKAVFAAYQVSNDINKRDLLIQDIRLLLGQLNNVPLAIERVRILEKDFPKQKHPFGYYLKPAEVRIAELFNRVSFHFVQQLLLYIDTELPNLSLVNRPRVSLEKKRDGSYQVVGQYDGDITLNQDRMSDIRMSFWMVSDRWVLIDTNLTPERGKWARAEREKLKTKRISEEEMMQNLENIFHQQFPKTALHEVVSAPSPVSKNLTE